MDVSSQAGPPTLPIGLEFEILSGPHDVGSEQRWRIQLGDGRCCTLAVLSPEFARDLSIRRRWVHDVERILALRSDGIAPILGLGPQPNPRSPESGSPWRLQLEPEGEDFSTILARAPIPLEEVSWRFAAAADALFRVHACGGVLRDIQPRQIVQTLSGSVVFTDVGLSRVDVLSSHTASSLLISGSRYASPEQIVCTVIDQRSDLYSLGVMMWEALTGTLPFGDEVAFLRESKPLPPLRSMRPDISGEVAWLVHRCLAERPEDRPESASEIAWVLRGGAADPMDCSATTQCQHCEARLRVGQRLCLRCGRVGVRFSHIPPGGRRALGG